VTIRAATNDDVAAILALDRHAASGDPERIASLEQWVPSGHCLVHTSEHVIDGFVVLRPRHFYARDFIDLLFVGADRRRGGVGRALLEAALAAATTPDVFTSTNRSNAPMQGLLEAHGWQFSGELQGLDEGDPELVYFRSRQPST
jgi:GNAT superfamily N-acetyltransferase